MHRFGRLSKLFVPVAGIGAMLQTAAFAPTQSNNPPLREYVSSSDVGHPHVTTRKNVVKDKMQQNPTVVESSLEWPRIPNIDENANRTMSAHEATLRQAEMVRNFRSTHQQMSSSSSSMSEAQETSKTEQIEIESPMQTQVEAQAQAQAQTQTQVQTHVIETEKEKETQAQVSVSEYIDHTALKAFVSKDEIKNLCNEAIKHNFASVCVNPVWVEYCSQLLKNTNVKVCTVIGFPLGANTTKIKVLEALQAVRDGATEIDMVISVAHIKSNEWDLVELEVASVVQAVEGPTMTSTNDNEDSNDNNNNNKVIVKVILETAMLTKEEIVKACKVCVRAGADYVKTSTGFGGGGATIENVKLMKQTVLQELLKENKDKNLCKIKASGGIRDFQSAKEMIKAGASRIGTSSGIKIIDGNINNSSSQIMSDY